MSAVATIRSPEASLQEVGTERWAAVGSFLFANFSLFVAGWLLLFVFVPVATFGWTPVVVTSGSMEPAVRAGDTVLLQPQTGEPLAPGTVVAFNDRTDSGTLTLHRIVGVHPDGSFRTRGDANAVDDRAPVHPTDIEGVARMLVPMVGLPAHWLRTSLPSFMVWFGLTLFAGWLVTAGPDLSKPSSAGSVRGIGPWSQGLRPATSLSALVRWWYVVVGTFAVGLVVTWLLLPASTSEPTSEQLADRDGTFKASYVLAIDGRSSASLDPGLVAMLARRGEVNGEVLDRMGAPITTRDVDDVVVEVDAEAGTISVTSVQPSPDLAAELVSVYAQQLRQVVEEGASTTLDDKLVRVKAQLGERAVAMEEAEGELTGLPADADDRIAREAELDALIEEFDQLQARSWSLASVRDAVDGVLVTASEPTPVRADPVEDARTGLPQDPAVRLAVGGLVSIALGVLLALLMDRFDTKVRRREDAEQAFGVPVIARLPRRSKRAVGSDPLPVVSAPASVTAEAFRSLARALDLAPLWKLSGPVLSGEGPAASITAMSEHEPPRRLLVTSPTVDEGRSVVTANLAAAIAASGRTVLVVDVDFRHPSVGRVLQAEPGGSLRDHGDPRRGRVDRLAVETGVDLVAYMASGAGGSTPSWLASAADVLVEQAASLVDVVIFDVGPLSSTDAALALVPNVDAVVVAVRSGRVSSRQARRSMGVLTQVGAAVAGVVLSGTRVPRDYFASYALESGSRDRWEAGRSDEVADPSDPATGSAGMPAPPPPPPPPPPPSAGPVQRSMASS